MILLAICGLGGPRRRRERLALGVIGGLFLLVAFGGHTPFYRAWYELMPMMKKVRAAGMAFYLPALAVCAFAGFGVDRILSGEVRSAPNPDRGGVFAALGLLGAVGGLEGIAKAVAAPELVQKTIQFAPELQAGALRLFLVAAAGGAVLYAIVTSRLVGTRRRRRALRGGHRRSLEPRPQVLRFPRHCRDTVRRRPDHLDDPKGSAALPGLGPEGRGPRARSVSRLLAHGPRHSAAARLPRPGAEQLRSIDGRQEYLGQPGQASRC